MEHVDNDKVSWAELHFKANAKHADDYFMPLQNKEKFNVQHTIYNKNMQLFIVE